MSHLNDYLKSLMVELTVTNQDVINALGAVRQFAQGMELSGLVKLKAARIAQVLAREEKVIRATMQEIVEQHLTRDAAGAIREPREFADNQAFAKAQDAIMNGGGVTIRSLQFTVAEVTKTEKGTDLLLPAGLSLEPLAPFILEEEPPGAAGAAPNVVGAIAPAAPASSPALVT
jgi:transcriptional regulator of nitric oxide reductase